MVSILLQVVPNLGILLGILNDVSIAEIAFRQQLISLLLQYLSVGTPLDFQVTLPNPPPPSRQGSASVFQITMHKNLNAFHRVSHSYPF
jgi:hypothetical protein